MDGKGRGRKRIRGIEVDDVELDEYLGLCECKRKLGISLSSTGRRAIHSDSSTDLYATTPASSMLVDLPNQK